MHRIVIDRTKSQPIAFDLSQKNGEKVPEFADIERELDAFRAEEAKRLGIVEEAVEHWFDPNPQQFTKAQRGTTTLLFGGLTEAQDYLIGGALRGLGYRVQPLRTPDYESLRYGKEFGNRGQCNPTYFTVGNLVKYLTELEQQGLSRAEIIRDYAFLTAGACGPCRFGMYVTEYRKALRDAGFEGFRVLLFQNDGGINQASGNDRGLELNPKFFIAVVTALVIGDILNVVGYRIRPYEVVPGATDAALTQCKKLLHDCFLRRGSTLLAVRACRKILDAVEVDWLQPKPKVSIIGEFWAMTTEGDGNYRLQRFLEQEGAEVDSQMILSWLFYQTWQARWDTKRRMLLRRSDHARMGNGDKNVRKTLLLISVAEFALHAAFRLYASLIGLRHYKLPDMREIATISHAHYDNHLRGGEGHMEVGKVIQTAQKRKAHMVVSVKPFGCMPSSGVSDGVQSLVSERHPEAIFCAIETTGDAAVNMQSRVQMQLFKARQMAARELEEALAKKGLTLDEAHRQMRLRGLSRATAYPHAHGIAGTAARFVAQMRGGRMLAMLARLVQSRPARSAAQ
jgi:predicted nucleotide-binding protein (sugar kinase/HSP70/actin superfamily)